MHFWEFMFTWRAFYTQSVVWSCSQSAASSASHSQWRLAGRTLHPQRRRSAAPGQRRPSSHTWSWVCRSISSGYQGWVYSCGSQARCPFHLVGEKTIKMNLNNVSMCSGHWANNIPVNFLNSLGSIQSQAAMMLWRLFHNINLYLCRWPSLSLGVEGINYSKTSYSRTWVSSPQF